MPGPGNRTRIAGGRGVLAVAILLAVVLAAGVVVFAATRPERSRPAPNIVLIQTDDQTVESLRAMPRTKQLVFAAGTTFANQTVNWPSCGPSRATLLTGQYAHNNRVLGNQPPRGGLERLDESETLPVWLDRRGYVTAHVGKYMNGYGERGDDGTEIPPGWDEWMSTVGESTQSEYDYELSENGEIVRYGRRDSDYKQDVLSDHAVELIREHARPEGESAPLYLQLDYTVPHASGARRSPRPPYDCRKAALPAERYADAFRTERAPRDVRFDERAIGEKPSAVRSLPRLDRSQRRRIDRRYRCSLASLGAVDEGVARIIAALRDEDALEDTYVIFTSDNGLLYGEHRIENGKDVVYDPATNVPLGIRGPGVDAGEYRFGATSNADLAPTIADLAGAEIEGLRPDGRSLVPALAGAEDPGRAVLVERRAPSRAEQYAAIRTRRNLYVEYDSGEIELYDMVSDRTQPRSLHRDPGQELRIEELSARLAELRRCAGRDCG